MALLLLPDVEKKDEDSAKKRIALLLLTLEDYLFTEWLNLLRLPALNGCGTNGKIPKEEMIT